MLKRVTLLALALPFVALADITKQNPVTGEAESYSYKYVGSGTWTATDWQDANGEPPVAVPQVAAAQDGDPTCFDSLLVEGEQSLSASIEGWTFNIGLFSGAQLTVPTLTKWQGGCTARVGSGSKLTISALGSGNSGNDINFYVAAQDGIAYACDYGKGGNFNYYFSGEGSVSYQNLTGGSHTIRAADITLSSPAEKTLATKTLVTFSNQPNFSLNAAVTVKGDQGAIVDTVYFLGSITATTPTITTDDPVGTCQFVKSASGIVLYYVDGDPAEYVSKTYTPSININFTNGGANGLTTGADVGLTGYEVPGTSWNNYVVANSTFSTVNAVDSTGAASAMSGVSVTISGTRGSHSCSSLTPSTNPLHGYIDENGNNPTPTVTVTGIPYYKYRVLVYHSTDSGSAPFGYDTINGTNYTYVNDALSEGTTAWGNAGAQNSANAIAEGSAEAGNVLVTGELSGPTLTVVGHRAGGHSSARGCIAAIQIIEVKADVGENDLEIPVSGDTQYTVEETKELSGTVYLTGLGTLTLAGENKISAATIEISEGVTLFVNADRLDATTFTGAGTVVYDGAQPSTTLGFDDSDNWTGTVWVKNVGTGGEATNSKVGTCLGTDTATASNNVIKDWGNANSFVKFTNVRGWVGTANCPWTLVLEDDGDTKAWYNNNGYTARSITIAGLKGDGTFWDINDGGCRPYLNFGDASQFTGTIKALGKQVFLNDTTNTGDASSGLAGRITVPANQTLTVASGKTWHTRNGLVVNGTLNVNGTLASDSTTAAVSGSGTVVFTGRVPTPTGNAWWKNASWTGAVQIAGVSNMTGNTSGTQIAFNDYGNEGSIVELNNVTGWLQSNFTCTPKLKVTGTLSLTNGSSGKNNAFKVGTLLGSGTISGSSLAPTAVFNVTDDWSGFTGGIALNNKCVVFGSTIPDELTAGTIYISEGAVVTPQQASGTWWAVGGIKVDGELRAPNLGKFGGGTNITTSDNGVFTLTSTGNGTEGETDTDYARIKGTGSLKYEGTGWRALTTNNLSTAVTLVNEQSGDILLSRALTYTIGSLSGSKKFQGNYGSGSRYLNIVQTKDTEWSGTIATDNDSHLAGFSLDATSTGTLTLSGTETQSATLAVNGGSVNLTGTWKGDTTVSGTFGGTGALTGNLTFNGGVLKTGTTPLTVSGDLTASGTVMVDISALTEGDIGNYKLLVSTDNVVGLNNFQLTDTQFMVVYRGEGLAVVPASVEEEEGIEFGAINLPGTLSPPTVTINGANFASTNSYEDETGTYSIYSIPMNSIGSVAYITYTATNGFVIVGDTVCEIKKFGSDYYYGYDEDDQASYPAVSNVSEIAEVAFITDVTGRYNTLYETIDDAVSAANAGEKITLMKDAVLTALDETRFHISHTTNTICGYGCNLGGNLKIGSGVSLIFESGITVTNDIIAMATATDSTITYPTNAVPPVQAPSGYEVRVTDNGDGTATISFKEAEPEPEPETLVTEIASIRLDANNVIITTTPTNAVGTLIVSTDIAAATVITNLTVDITGETTYDKGDYPSLFFRLQQPKATE